MALGTIKIDGGGVAVISSARILEAQEDAKLLLQVIDCDGKVQAAARSLLQLATSTLALPTTSNSVSGDEVVVDTGDILGREDDSKESRCEVPSEAAAAATVGEGTGGKKGDGGGGGGGGVGGDGGAAAPSHAALPHTPARVVSDAKLQLVQRLIRYTTSTTESMRRESDLWVESEFAGDAAAVVAAAAEGGNRKANFAMMLWMRPADQATYLSLTSNTAGNAYCLLWDLLQSTALVARSFIVEDTSAALPDLSVSIDHLMAYFQTLAENGSAEAQFLLGLLMYCCHYDSSGKLKLRNAARWIRKAAKQGVAEAQYELGEMFRLSIFCNVRMRFARNYIRRASVQGHVEAVERMKELRSCVLCGTDDAQLACSLCHQARYSNSTCSEKHWCEGIDLGGGVGGGATPAHKDTCPRTHSRRSYDNVRGV
jgi:hypothetical protein